MDGVTVSASDINTVTAKAPTASPTFTGDVTIPDKIVHDGDTNTAIRFADADTVTVETGGTERMRIDDSGRVNVAATTGNEKLNVAGALGVSGASANFSGGNERALVDFTGTLARFGHVNGASGSAKDVSILSGGGEKFRFGSSGQLGIGGATYGTSGQVLTSGGASAAPSWVDASGGGSIGLTASGSITAGDPVGINSSGTVQKLIPPANKVNISSGMDTGNNSMHITTIYIGSNKVLFFWKEESHQYRAQIGTLSGSSMSLGTLYTVNDDTSSSSPSYGRAVYASNTGQVIFFYTYGGNSDRGYARAATVSGTSLSFGSEINIGNNNALYMGAMGWDASAQRAILVYRYNNKCTYSLVSVSGNTLTVQQDLQDVGDGSNVTNGTRVVYDSTAQKTIVFYPDPSNNKLKIVCMDVGSSSVTQGTQVARSSDRYFGDQRLGAAFVPGINKVGYAYIVNGSSSDVPHTIRAGTITLSGTTITVNENQVLDHDNINDYTYLEYSVDNNGKVLITYDDNDGSLDDKIRAIIGSYSGNTFSSVKADFTLIEGLILAGPMSQCFTDSTNNKFVHFAHQSTGQAATDRGYVANVIGGFDDLISFDNWIGLASQSVSDGASVDVTVQGGLNENQSSLDVGQKYYIQDDGTIGTTLKENREIGIATAATKVFLTNGSILIGPTGYNAN
tara:strand:+ start:10 stop:2049 length:2040 start_codon:yes stop_codon:yes gene_type:complete